MVSTRGQSRRTELFWAAMRVIRQVEQEFFRLLRVNRLKATYYLRRRLTLWPGWDYYTPSLLPGGGDVMGAPSLNAVLSETNSYGGIGRMRRGPGY